MKNQSCSKCFKIIMFALTAALIAFAFIHSSMPSDISGRESEGVLNFLQGIINFFKLNITLTEYTVRKLAHFTEYTALGCLMMSCAYSFNRYRPHKYYFQILFTGLFTAVIDETIQINVEGRAGLVTDVLLDFTGVLIGSFVMLLIFALYRKIKKMKYK